MAGKLLQINFTYAMEPDQYRQGMMHAADPIAAQDGLVWKVWPIAEDRREGGGWYLFESEEQALAYLDSPIVAQLKANPAITGFSAKLFDIGEAATMVTRGPVG